MPSEPSAETCDQEYEDGYDARMEYVMRLNNPHPGHFDPDHHLARQRAAWFGGWDAADAPRS